MNAIVESPVQHFSVGNYKKALIELAIILQQITTVKTREELKANMEYLTNIGQINNYEYGFGGDHMWVKQRGNDDRIILVKF